ncbi:hypothetical protein [Henriciella aquimarina]|uniref:hypothetical protein n=1 Tax=Henriciella aquimarina TaxID=545261 RepID=UPI00117A9EE0|nr:hypothetical protein [Henriciella aquimarina]
MRELNNEAQPDNLAYYVEGNADAATCLKLKLNVNSGNDAPGSEIVLLIALQKLIERATGYYAMHLQLEKSREELAGIDFGSGVLKWRYDPHLREGYSLVASIVRGSSSD